MRIDVGLEHRDLDAELARLHARMHTPGDALHAMATLPIPVPGMALRYREVAGEFYIYVEDEVHGALAGCTVFNRIAELDAHAGSCLRSPHSRYGTAYQRRGLARTVYTWALQAGLCLVTGPRQSEAAHRLWHALGQAHELLFVRIAGKRLQCLDGAPEGEGLASLDTRMALLGAGWDRARFADWPRLQNGG